MKQSINLLTDDIIEHLPKLNIYVIVGLLTLEIAVISTFVMLKYQQTNGAKIAYLNIQADYDVRSLELETLKEEFVPKEKDENLNNTANRLQKEVDGKQEILGLLQYSHIEKQALPSGLLTAIADKLVAGLWLTDVRLQPQSQHILLKGKTLDAKQITVYLESLAQSEAFYGVEFSSLRMNRIKESRHLNFQISTEHPSSDGQAGEAASKVSTQ